MAWIVSNLDPVAFYLGPFPIRWYGLAYVLGVFLGWRLAISLLPRFPNLSRKNLDDFMTWILGSIVLGGRFGYALFYNPSLFLSAKIFAIWEGGMAFHGGLIGASLATVIYCHMRQVPLWVLADICSVVSPLGLCLGRLANFVNQEVCGRVTDVPWGVIFPRLGFDLRHPSQLYEAFFEGIILWASLMLALRRSWSQKPGMLTGLFFLGYTIARISSEYFREPEVQLGVLGEWVTWGQLLSLPMGGLGLYLILHHRFSHRT